MPITTNYQSNVDIIELHPNEVWLLNKMRNEFSFGEITVIVQNGVPLRIKRVQYNISPKDEKLWKKNH